MRSRLRMGWVALGLGMMACLVLWYFQVGWRQTDPTDYVSGRLAALSDPVVEDSAAGAPLVPAVVGHAPVAGSPLDSQVSSAPAKNGVGATGDLQLGPAGVAAEGPRVAVRRVLSERWLDPETKDVRRRVRVVETDFKYPLLRVEDEVVRTADGSVKTIFRQASVADHVMVGFNAGSAAAKDRLTAAGWKVRAVGRDLFALVEVANPQDLDALPAMVERLRVEMPEVAYVENDPVVWADAVPNDPKFLSGELWGLANPGGRSNYTTDADIDAPEGWDALHSAPDTIVAVLDTGIRYTHEDLAANMWTNPGEIPGNGIDDDFNGVVDDVHGYDAANNDGDPADDQGHGTHCAGTIGAVGNNGRGITGVAWGVKLMAVKFLTSSGAGATSDAILGIDYARASGARVINASWGGGARHAGLLDAIQRCGDENVAFVAAAGNEGTNNDSTPHYPSSYQARNLIAVAATGADDRLAAFSCFGRNSVQIAAPGVDIVSTFNTSDEAYRSLSGTSMATPHVSGMLALARARFPNDGVSDLLKRLTQSADKLDSLSGQVAKGARANLAGLLGAVPPGDPVTGGPDNDNFANAVRIEGTSVAWSGTNAKATREPAEGSYHPAQGARTVWLAWLAEQEGIVDLTVEALPAGHGLRVLVFETRETGDLTAVADSGRTAEESGPARLRFRATAGMDYRVMVSSDSEDGQFLTLGLDQRPPNDNLADASEAEGHSFSVAGSTAGATAEPFEILAPHAEIGVGKSVWWKWVAPFSGPFVLTTEGSEFDTVLAVYAPGTGESPPIGIVSNDDAGPLDGSSALEFQAVEGSTYLIAIDGYRDDAQGPCKLNGFRPGPPLIVSQPADSKVPLGTRATFSVGAVGSLQLAYQWFKDDAALPGQRAESLVIDPVKMQDLGGYSVEVSNGREATVSRIALLEEKLLPPEITWNSGNVAVLLDGAAALRIQVSGSEPMTFAWTKDGTAIEGAASPSLALDHATPADGGVYVCTAANAVGSAEARLVVSVVKSPFDALTWARDSVPNSPITDLKEIDGKCYAVAGERILVSPDAREWTPWMLPAGFEGATLAKLGSSWYCSGFRVDGQHSMAISTDGLTWAEPVPVTGLDPIAASRGVPMLQMEAFGGRLIGTSSTVPPGTSSPDYTTIYHSANGIAWTKTQRRMADNSLAPFVTPARFLSWGGKLYLPAERPGTGSNINATVLISSDGMTWEETLLPVNPDGRSTGSGSFIIPSGGVLYLFSSWGAFTSPDGVAWTFQGFRSGSGGAYGRYAAAADGVYGFNLESQSFAFGASPLDWAPYQIQPATAQNFSSAIGFQGAAVFGTSNGLLRRVDRRQDVTLATGTTYPLESIRFINDEFIAYRAISSSGSEGPLLVSGDGQTWRPGRSFGVTTPGSNFAASAGIGGRYFGFASGSANAPVSGWAPSAMSGVAPPAGVTGGVISAAFDGTRWIVLTVSGAGCYSVTPDGNTWTKLTLTGYTPAVGDTIVRFNNRWYVSSPNNSSARLKVSADGTTWSEVQGISPANLTLFGQKLAGISEDGSTCYLTTDGVAWQSFPIVTGIKTTGTGGSRVSALRLVEFNGSLVMLVREIYSDRGFLFFSNDGQGWLRAPVTTRIRDVAVGKGVLVAVTLNGGVILSRGSGATGSAPITSITSPRHRSVHVNGSTVEITGTAIDPDGQPVTTECFVDGTRLGTTVDGAFAFSFQPTSATGHVVTVRSRDPQGLVGSDEVLVSAIAPQLPNRLDSEEGKSFIPQTWWSSFGGHVYAAGPYSLYRSRPDGAWEQVVLPTLSSPIKGIVSGNGTLIVQTATTALLTRDGVNWWQINGLGTGNYMVARPIEFKDGWFIGATDANPSAPFYSRDGLSWTYGAAIPVNTAAVTGPVVTPGGILLASPPFRSVDGGMNWLAIPEFSGIGVMQIQLAPAFGSVFAGLADGRVFRSVDEGASWQMMAQFPPLPAGQHARISFQAGRLWWGGGGSWLASSADGAGWQPLAGAAVVSSKMEWINGRFVAFGRSGMVWSADGVVWGTAPSSPADAVAGMLAADLHSLLLGDSLGGLWRTTDGLEWTRLMPGKALPPPPAVLDFSTATSIRIAGRTVIGWSGGNYRNLYHSGNGGLDWQWATYQGGLMPTVDVKNIWSDGTTAFASVARVESIEGRDVNELWRSTDGIDWTRHWEWTHGVIADMRADGGTWLAMGLKGDLRRSRDAGNSWSEDLLPTMLGGRLLTRFDGLWIAIGSEVENLQGPSIIYTSPDSQTWTRRGGLTGETGWSAIGSATSDTAIVVVTGYGQVFTATDSSLAWTLTATTNFFSFPAVPIVELVGAKFSIRDRLVSDDGITWTVPAGNFFGTPAVQFAGVYLTFPYYRNPYWSLDGLNWTEMTGSSTLRNKPPFAIAAGVLHARDNSGVTWATTDGKSWVLAGEGPPDTTGQAYAKRIVALGQRLVAAGTAGMVVVSPDDGKSWQTATFNGRPFSAALRIRDLEASNSEVIAVFNINTNAFFPVCRYFRSTDGSTWTELTSLNGLDLVDVVAADGKWMGIRADGKLLASIDGGLTWTDAGAVSGVVGGRNIARINGLWVVAGTTSTGFNTPLSLFTSPDGATWTNRGSSAINDDQFTDGPPVFTTGHGLLFFGRGPESKQTADGITWTPMGKGGNTNSPDGSGYQAKWMVPVADGFVAFNSDTNFSRSYFWTAPTAGGSWAVAPVYQNQVAWIGSLNSSRLFLFGSGTIKEWTTADLALSVTDPVAGDFGVGDNLVVPITLRNLGSQPVAGGDPLPVDAWLSSDGFFGDGNDIYIGRVDLPVAAPSPGAQVTCNLTFPLPDTIEPGSQHVVLRIDTEGRLDESNRANNTALTRRAVVNIPQWQMNLVTQGSGEVLSTSARRFYPHKASIGLFARAGKGAAFGGWGGDAIGGLSETSILMDGNKNVSATFVAQASLRVVAIGNGTVNVPNSGTVPLGSNIILRATPAAGWEFDRWEGAVSGTAAGLPLRVDGNKVVRAYFRQTLAGWKQRYFIPAQLSLPAVSGDFADPDGDGVPNWQEFAHGSKPLDPGSTGRGRIVRDGDELVVVFTRHQNPADGTRVDCQSARTLTDWGNAGLVLQVLDQSEGVETLEARLPMKGNRRGFLRFTYSRP